MKTSAGTLVMLGAVLLAGPAFAQSANLNSSGATIAVEITARPPVSATGARETGEEANSGGGRQSSGTATAPVNGVNGVRGVKGAAEAAAADERALTEVPGSRGADFRSGTGSPAPANVSVVRNSCVAPNTVELVTLSGLNTLEYTFQRLPNGPNFVFPGIANPTSLNNPRRFVLPNGTYRLTFRHPNTTPIGVWPQNVVIQPHHIVGGTCVPTDPRTRPGLPTSPVQ